MNKQLTLEVCVVTFGEQGGERLQRMQLPELPQVSYLVSWQERGQTPVPESIASRADIRVLDLDGLGSSKNRNNCLDHAKGDIVYFADDDLRLYPEGLQQILETFRRNPDLEYGSFAYDSDVPKQYPSKECSLAKLPKNFYQTTFEIALRMDSRAGRLRFSEDHGFAVKDFPAAEDELLLLRARRKHLNCRFFPIKVAFHPGATSGTRDRLQDEVIFTMGALTLLLYPWSWIPRLMLMGWRMARNRKAPLFQAYRLLLGGAWKELTSRKGYTYLRSPL